MPFLFNLVILKVALPFELVFAEYDLPLTFTVTLVFFMTLYVLSFRTMENFLVFSLAKYFMFDTMMNGFAFLTVIEAEADDVSQLPDGEIDPEFL